MAQGDALWYPPSNLRRIIDASVRFVAKRGRDFEERFKADSVGNDKYSFLIASDPNHPYYQHQLSKSIKKVRYDNHLRTMLINVLGDFPHESRRIVEKLSATHPHIFFKPTQEEVYNALKEEIDKKKKEDKLMWDAGPSSPASPPRPSPPFEMQDSDPPNNASTLPPPMLTSNSSVTPPPPPESQFTLPKPSAPLPVPPPSINMISPPPLPQGVPPPFTDEPEPEPKRQRVDDSDRDTEPESEPERQRVDDSSLIPEDNFLAQHLGPARIMVYVPNVDKGNLKGQFLEIMMQSLSETIGNIKEKIAREIQLPVNKQKLKGRAAFLKDNMSLAHYNIEAGETLTLSVGDRGGRKKYFTSF